MVPSHLKLGSVSRRLLISICLATSTVLLTKSIGVVPISFHAFLVRATMGLITKYLYHKEQISSLYLKIDHLLL